MTRILSPLPDPVDVARDVLETGMRRPQVNETAFGRAVQQYDITYGRAYSQGCEHAMDEYDRFQAHYEAHSEALEAFLTTYLEGSR